MCAAVISCCDAPPVFKFSEHVFYLVTLFIEDFIVFVLDLAVFLGRDARSDAFLDQGLSEPVGIITTIRQKLSRLG